MVFVWEFRNHDYLGHWSFREGNSGGLVTRKVLDQISHQPVPCNQMTFFQNERLIPRGSAFANKKKFRTPRCFLMSHTRDFKAVSLRSSQSDQQHASLALSCSLTCPYVSVHSLFLLKSRLLPLATCSNVSWKCEARYASEGSGLVLLELIAGKAACGGATGRWNCATVVPSSWTAWPNSSSPGSVVVFDLPSPYTGLQDIIFLLLEGYQQVIVFSLHFDPLLGCRRIPFSFACNSFQSVSLSLFSLSLSLSLSLLLGVSIVSAVLIIISIILIFPDGGAQLGHLLSVRGPCQGQLCDLFDPWGRSVMVGTFSPV